MRMSVLQHWDLPTKKESQSWNKVGCPVHSVFCDCGTHLNVLLIRCLFVCMMLILILTWNCFVQVGNAEYSCPSWFPVGAKSLIQRILDPNPETVSTSVWQTSVNGFHFAHCSHCSFEYYSRLAIVFCYSTLYSWGTTLSTSILKGLETSISHVENASYIYHFTSMT